MITCNMSSRSGREEGLGAADKQEYSLRGPGTRQNSRPVPGTEGQRGRSTVSTARTAPRGWRSGLRTRGPSRQRYPSRSEKCASGAFQHRNEVTAREVAWRPAWKGARMLQGLVGTLQQRRRGTRAAAGSGGGHRDGETSMNYGLFRR